MNKLAQLSLPGTSVNYPEGFSLEGATIGTLISNVLPYVFGILGFILLFMLIFGGFQLLTSAGNPETVKAGQAKIVNALIGFVIVMAAYWIIQILQVVFGLTILG